VAKLPKGMVLDGDSQDYSHLYRNFYDIFVGHHNGLKDFELNYCVRDARNVYASFVNLLDTNALLMQQKHRFEKHPLELGIRELFPNVFNVNGKNLVEQEQQNNQLMIQAMNE
jgi:hypothetical protein